MRPPIDGGVVMVTGVSSGIGLEMARLLGPRAKKLILVARRADRLEALANELEEKTANLNVDVRPCDLSDLAATEALAKRVLEENGTVDVLINNAGLGDLSVYDRSEWGKIQRMLRVNVDAVLLLTHRLLPAMVEKRRGGILNVSSGFGLQFMPGFAAYVGTKHFVSGFTESLRIDLKGTGVVVSQVCPGPVATEFEQGTGNPTGQKVPSFVELDPARCARIAIRGFDKNRALTVPGLLMKITLFLGAHTPRWFLRLIYGPAATMLRKKQTA